MLHSQRGQTLVEVILTIGLASILLPALLTGLVASREGRAQQLQRIQAVTLLKEGQEATRSVRERGWSTFAINGTYHPQVSGSEWILVSGAETINGFTRQIVVSDVYRNTLSGPIVNQGDPGAILDPSSKKIVTTISWSQPFTTSINSTSYLTRHLENASYTETTQAHFNAGVKTGVNVQATNPPGVADDGEVILSSGGHSNWCTPAIDATTLDLPKNGVAQALYAIEGSAFATTGENSSGVSFAKVTIGNSPPYPPVPSLANTFDGYKTNGVFGETNYAYIATDNNSKEVVIIDLNNVVGGKYQEVGNFNAPGNTSGKSVYVSGNTGYVIVGSNLYNFDLTSKSGSRSIMDTNGVSLAGTGNSVVVSGNYAYVTTNDSSNDLQIIDVSNTTNLTVAGQANVNSAAAVDVYVNSASTRAYVAAAVSSSQQEMFIVDISTKTGNRPTLGSYEANGMNPKAITNVPGNRTVLVGTSGEEYQVIDISNEASPSRCGGVEVDTGINDVASILEADNDAFSYILVAGDPEFRIVEGGPGGSYTSTGTFESAVFNPGYQTANNRLTAIFNKPAGTSIEFQVTMANLVGGNCPGAGGYTYVGPDGTSSTRFNQDSGVAITFPFASYPPSYDNPGQCMRYKVYFSTTDTNATPILNEVTVNYSP